MPKHLLQRKIDECKRKNEKTNGEINFKKKQSKKKTHKDMGGWKWQGWYYNQMLAMKPSSKLWFWSWREKLFKEMNFFQDVREKVLAFESISFNSWKENFSLFFL